MSLHSDTSEVDPLYKEGHKSRETKWVGHVAHQRTSNVYKILFKTLKGRGLLKNLGKWRDLLGLSVWMGLVVFCHT